MKTAEQVTVAKAAAQSVIDANSLEQEDGENPLAALGWAMGGQMEYEDALTRFAAAAIEADRAQRRIPFDTLDHMLNAWEGYDGDVSGFIEAWADHFNEGTEVPDWAKA